MKHQWHLHISEELSLDFYMKHSLLLMQLIWPRQPSSMCSKQGVAAQPFAHVNREYAARTSLPHKDKSTGSTNTLWMYVPTTDILPHLFPNSTSFNLYQRFSKINASKSHMQRCFLCSLPVQNQLITCSMKFITHHAKQASSWVHLFLMLSYFVAGQIPLILVTVISRTNVHESRPWMILSIILSGSFLPFRALLWEHRWLALGLKPALPGTGTSASSWLCTLLHSDDFFRALPSSLFLLVYDLACLASLLCLQPPGNEEYTRDDVLQREHWDHVIVTTAGSRWPVNSLAKLI